MYSNFKELNVTLVLNMLYIKLYLSISYIIQIYNILYKTLINRYYKKLL